jgi:DUF4097 and DUF4098 domain-containing protein YvlB
MNKTAARSIQAGIILIALGGFFLYENLVGEISIFRVIGKYFPVLFLWIGAVKTWRYFQPAAGDTRPRSLSPALLWLAGGTFLLLWTLGTIHGFFNLLGTWWPLFLIVMGAGKLVDAVTPGRVVRLSGGEIVFLLLLIPAGLISLPIARLDLSRFPAIPFGDKKFQVRDLLKSSIRQETQFVINPAGARTLVLTHANGEVDLVPADTDQIQVKMDAKIYADTNEAAQAAGNILHMNSEPDGDQLRLSLPVLTDDRTSAEVKLRLAVPADIRIRVENTFGDISAGELRNPLELSARNGRITVTGQKGPVTVTNRYSKVSLTDIEGDVQVNGTDAKIQVEKVTGAVTAEIKNGSIHLSEIQGPVKVASHYGSLEGEGLTGDVTVQGTEAHIQLQGLKGTVNIDNSREDVEVSDVQGNLILKIRSGDINLNQIVGAIQGEVTGGSLEIEDARAVTLTLDKCRGTLKKIDGPIQVTNSTNTLTLDGVQGPVDVKNANANIVFRGLPANPTVRIAAATERGDITFYLADFPGSRLFRLSSLGGNLRSDFGAAAPSPTAEKGAQVWQNLTGKGQQPALTATAQYGNIRVRKQNPSDEEED